jgi:hypothetical protein
MTWDLTSYFPAFDGPEMRQFKAGLQADIEMLKQQAGALAALDDENAGAWEEILLRNEELTRRMSHLGSYIGCLASADAIKGLKQQVDKEVTTLSDFKGKGHKLARRGYQNKSPCRDPQTGRQEDAPQIQHDAERAPPGGNTIFRARSIAAPTILVRWPHARTHSRAMRIGTSRSMPNISRSTKAFRRGYCRRWPEAEGRHRFSS